MMADMPKVKFETTLGDFVLTLNDEKAPITVENFLSYVTDGFFEDTIFHRVIPGFMVQGGGFTVEMIQKETKAPIENEYENGLKNNRSTISMARTSDPNSATCQFFLNVNDNAPLNGGGGQAGYAVFGEITEGMDIVDAIVNVETETVGHHDDVPCDSVIVKSTTVI